MVFGYPFYPNNGDWGTEIWSLFTSETEIKTPVIFLKRSSLKRIFDIY